MRRRHFIGLAGAAAAGAALEGLVLEPRRLAVSRQALPERFRGVSFALIADLHLRHVGRIHETLAGAVHDAAPAFILIAGDSVDRADALPQLSRFLDLLAPAVPAYAILGNWEHWSGVDQRALRAAYERRGVRLLVNESVEEQMAATRLRITGLDDLLGGRPAVAAALGGAMPSTAHLVMAHCPAHRDLLAGEMDGRRAAGLTLSPSADPAHLAGALVLSGHTHGGQVNIGGLAPLRPEGSGRYRAGWYRDQGLPDLYVSRGIGNSVLPVRLGSVPELTLFSGPAAPAPS